MAQDKRNGVCYYNVDNVDNEVYNIENITNISSSLDTGGDASLIHLDSKGETKSLGKVVEQAATPELPNQDTVERAIAQIFENKNSTQKHKIKLKLHLTDKMSPEFIASMSKDPRVFRKYQTDIDLAREWLQITREYFAQDQGFKKPYWGKFHIARDDTGKQIQGIQKEPGCYASMAYSTRDDSWYAMFKIYDWITAPMEFDYSFTGLQKAQGVKAQWVWSNPRLQRTKRPTTWAERTGRK
jgi:hypothetical protein